MSLVTPVQSSSSGYAVLAREIRRLGLLQPRTGYYSAAIATNLLALGAVLTAVVLLRDSWWLVAIAPAFAIVSTQTAFLGHDAAHRQVSRRARTSALLGLLHGNLLNGLSYGWWVDKHNAHHAHPNDLDSDPDVAAGAFVFDHGQAATRTGVAAWMTRHQAVLFFPMLLLEALNLHITSGRFILRGPCRARRAEAVAFVAHFAWYAALVVTTMTWSQALVFVALHQGLFGLYLGCTFAPSHKGMPTLSAEQDADPLLRQVLTSRNIRGGPFVGFVYGGLNLQIEHHLFPSMPRPNLRRAQPVIERFCREHGVPYAVASAGGAYGAALGHLRGVGSALRATS